MTTLAQLLAEHSPEDERERADLLRMRAHLEQLASPFSRAQPSAHFTGSAVVVPPAQDRVLLIRHRKLGRWLQPGGHCEAEDQQLLWATALREVREETGLRATLHPAAPRPLDVDAHRIPGRPGEPEHLHLDVRFLAIAEHPEELQHDPAETFGARWLSFEEALQVADEPGLRRMFTKAARVCRVRLPA